MENRGMTPAVKWMNGESPCSILHARLKKEAGPGGPPLFIVRRTLRF